MQSKATRTGATSPLRGAGTQNRNRASLLAPGLASTAVGRKVTVTSWWHSQPALQQQQHKAQQLLPAQASLNCCHFTWEKGREGQVLPLIFGMGGVGLAAHSKNRGLQLQVIRVGTDQSPPLAPWPQSIKIQWPKHSQAGTTTPGTSVLPPPAPLSSSPPSWLD